MENNINEKQISKEEIQKELDAMQQNIFMNNITCNDFEAYFNYLKTLINNNLIENSLSYLLTLSTASILPIKTDIDMGKLLDYEKELEDLIAKELQKNLQKAGIDLIQKLENIKANIDRSYISTNQFCDYCETLRLGFLSKIDKEYLLEIAKSLQQIKVIPTTTYDEAIKLNRYKKSINEYIAKLEQQENKKL